MSLNPYPVIVVKIVSNLNCRYGRYCHYFIMCHHVIMPLNPYLVIVVKIVSNPNCRYGRYSRCCHYFIMCHHVLMSLIPYLVIVVKSSPTLIVVTVVTTPNIIPSLPHNFSPLVRPVMKFVQGNS